MTEENRPLPTEFFADWKEREALAEGMIPLIGRLYRRRNVSLYMYGKRMINQSVTDLMKAHRFVRQINCRITLRTSAHRCGQNGLSLF